MNAHVCDSRRAKRKHVSLRPCGALLLPVPDGESRQGDPSLAEPARKHCRPGSSGVSSTVQLQRHDSYRSTALVKVPSTPATLVQHRRQRRPGELADVIGVSREVSSHCQSGDTKRVALKIGHLDNETVKYASQLLKIIKRGVDVLKNMDEYGYVEAFVPDDVRGRFDAVLHVGGSCRFARELYVRRTVIDTDDDASVVFHL